MTFTCIGFKVVLLRYHSNITFRVFIKEFVSFSWFSPEAKEVLLTAKLENSEVSI